MTPDRTLVIPGEGHRSVLVRPVVAGMALGVGISAVVLAWMTVAGELDAREPAAAAAIMVVPVVILAALGALQAARWRHKLGSIQYQADDAILRVVQGDVVIGEWGWSDIHKLRLEGAVDWYSLIVLRAGTDDFPRLVVHSNGGLTRAPGVLLWGRDNAQEVQRQLVELQRAAAP